MAIHDDERHFYAAGPITMGIYRHADDRRFFIAYGAVDHLRQRAVTHLRAIDLMVVDCFGELTPIPSFRRKPETRSHE